MRLPLQSIRTENVPVVQILLSLTAPPNVTLDKVATAHGLVHIGSADGDLAGASASCCESPRENRRSAVATVPTQSRLLLNRIRMCHEGQHVAEGPAFRVTIEADDDHVFTMTIHRLAHEWNQTIHEELCLIHNNGRRRGKFRPLQNRGEPAHINSACRNGRAIMIDNRRHRRLIAIVNIGCNNEDTTPQASIAAYNALDFGGLTGEHWSDNNTEAHRTRNNPRLTPFIFSESGPQPPKERVAYCAPQT